MVRDTWRVCHYPSAANSLVLLIAGAVRHQRRAVAACKTERPRISKCLALRAGVHRQSRMCICCLHVPFNTICICRYCCRGFQTPISFLALPFRRWAFIPDMGANPIDQVRRRGLFEAMHLRLSKGSKASVQGAVAWADYGAGLATWSRRRLRRECLHNTHATNAPLQL
eukprot:6047749-Pleurochrysis_carterae.AAC.1